MGSVEDLMASSRARVTHYLRPESEWWREACDGGPVQRTDDPGWREAYALTRREDILGALRNKPPALSMHTVVNVAGAGSVPMTRRHYEACQKAFNRSTKLMLPSLRKRLGTWIDAWVEAGSCDGTRDVAVTFAAIVIFDICELSDGGGSIDLDRMILTLDPDLIPARRRAPGSDLISRMILAAPELPDGEIEGLVQQGWESITVMVGTVGHALLELALDPGLQDRLRGNPRDQRIFVDEMLRLDGAPAAARLTTEPVTVAGVTIPPGSKVSLAMSCINRDGSDEMSTDELRMDGPHRNYAFGVGDHRCPAGHFIRGVLVAFVDEWLSRIPKFHVPPGYEPMTLAVEPEGINPRATVRWALRGLPLRW